MFGADEEKFFFDITWLQVVRHAVISVTATLLAVWALKKSGKWPRR